MPTPADNPSTPSSPARPSIREARLRPEHAAIYPGVPAGEWVAAATLAKQILTGLVSREGAPPLINARLMDDAHFEFRGGERNPRAKRYSRAHELGTDAE